MQPFDFHARTCVVFREGALSLVGDLARSLDFERALLVADRGMVAAGFVERAEHLLGAADNAAVAFHDFDVNPDSAMIDEGRAYAAGQAVDSRRSPTQSSRIR